MHVNVGLCTHSKGDPAETAAQGGQAGLNVPVTTLRSIWNPGCLILTYFDCLLERMKIQCSGKFEHI